MTSLTLLAAVLLWGRCRATAQTNAQAAFHDNSASALPFGEEITVLGRVSSIPQTAAQVVHFDLTLTTIALSNQPPRPAVGIVQMRYFGSAGLALQAGDEIRARTKLNRLLIYSNPGVDRRRVELLRRRGYVATSSISRASDLSLVGRKLSLLRAADWLHRRMISNIESSGRVSDGQLLVRTLVAGDRLSLPREIETSFREAGVVHVLSVSGLHMASLFWLLGRFVAACFRRTSLCETIPAQVLATSVVAPLLLLYAVATGGSPPAIRALIFALLLLGATLFRRAVDARGAFWIALANALWTSPAALFDPSVLLSFSAVGTLLLCAKPIHAWSRSCFRLDEAPTKSHAVRKWLHFRVRQLSAACVTLFALSIAIAAVEAPLTGAAFSTVCIGGIWSNAFAIPAIELLLLPLALIGVLAAEIVPPLGAVIIATAAKIGSLVIVVVDFLADYSPLLHVREPTPIEIILLWLLLAAACFAHLHARKWMTPARRTVRFIAVAAVTFAYVFGLFRSERALAQSDQHMLTVHFLDVGQGDSTLVQLPNGEAILCDAGGALPVGAPISAHQDPGALAVVPALKALGVRDLALVLISHPHPDHVGGLAAVAEAVPIRELWWSGDSRGGNQWSALLAKMAEKGTIVRIPTTADEVRRFGAVELTLLHPLKRNAPDTDDNAERDESDSYGRYAIRNGPATNSVATISADESLSMNDNSIVAKIVYQGRSFLLSGDLEYDGEDLLVAYQDARALRASLLKVPHHGSRTSSSEALLRSVSPDFAVISCALGNRFNFPDSDVVERLRAGGTRVLSTAEYGAVSVAVSRVGEMEISCARKKCDEALVNWP